MDGRRDGIVCRGCDTTFPVEEGSCPECGTRVRGRLGPAIAVVAGLVLLYTSVFPLDALSALLGLAMLAVGVHVLRDRRDRIREAEERLR